MMAQNSILLALGLPVYNGQNCIEETLKSISQSLSFIDAQLIEIIVSDNCSTDNTTEIIEKYINENKDIRILYYANEINLGYDRNIDLIVNRSSGKYVWFIGCGEKLKEDSLCRLLKILQNGFYTNVLVDFDIYDEKLSAISQRQIFDFKDNILLRGKNNFSYNRYNPAVSGNIVNRELWNKVSVEKLYVNGWCHIERILSMIALSDDSQTLLLPGPFFTLFREKNGWWTKSNSYLLLLLHIKVIRSMKAKGFDDKVVLNLERKQSHLALIRAMIQSKSYGLKVNKKVLSELFELFKYDYFFWFTVLPLLLIPNQIYKSKITKVAYKVAKKLYKKLKSELS